MSSVQESPQSSAAGQAACEAFRIFERPRAGAYTRGASRAIFLSCYDVQQQGTFSVCWVRYCGLQSKEELGTNIHIDKVVRFAKLKATSGLSERILCKKTKADTCPPLSVEYLCLIKKF